MYSDMKAEVSDMIDKVKNMDGDNCDSVLQDVKSRLGNVDTLADALE